MSASQRLTDVIQIRAMEAGDVFVGLAELELFDDVVADVLGGAGGEGGDGAIGEMGAQIIELAVFGAEFVAPFGDAVGFVDYEIGDGNVAQPFDGGSSARCVRARDRAGGNLPSVAASMISSVRFSCYEAV